MGQGDEERVTKKKVAKKKAVTGSKVARKAQAPELIVVKSIKTVQLTKKPEKKRPIRNIHKHADLETRRHFEAICTGLVTKAKEGGLGHTRLLMKISGLDQKPEPGKQRRGKSLSAMLLEELERAKQKPAEEQVKA